MTNDEQTTEVKNHHSEGSHQSLYNYHQKYPSYQIQPQSLNVATKRTSPCEKGEVLCRSDQYKSINCSFDICSSHISKSFLVEFHLQLKCKLLIIGITLRTTLLFERKKYIRILITSVQVQQRKRS